MCNAGEPLLYRRLLCAKSLAIATVPSPSKIGCHVQTPAIRKYLAFFAGLGYCFRHFAIDRTRMNWKIAGSLLLAALPFLAVCLSVWLWDRIYPLVFGLPFNLAWLIAWIPLTSLCMAGVYRLWRSQSYDGSSA